MSTKELQKSIVLINYLGGIVIVGGSAAIPGLAEFAKGRLQLPARIGKIRELAGLVDTVDDPSFATATGLMLLDILLAPFVNDQVTSTDLFGGSLQSSVGKLLKRIRS